MAKITVKKETLENLVPVYGEKNTECNALKKVVADLNTKIKATIKDLGCQNKDIIISGWKCSLTVSEEEKTNEDRLLEILRANNVPAIRTKEYVDSEELERLIYGGKVSKEVLLEMDKCIERTSKETLRCVKVKE